MQQYGNEEIRDFSHLVVTFFPEPVKDEAASEKEGRPIFNDVDKVRIQIAGDPKSVFVGFAHESSPERGPDGQALTYAELHLPIYEAYRQGVEYVGPGTPLTELPFLTVARAAELRALKIFTAEALAGLDGRNLARLGMDGRKLKEQAEAFIARASGTAEYTKLAEENASMAAKIAAMEAKIEALVAGGSGDGATVSQSDDQSKVSADNPFADWNREDCIAWLKDTGGQEPHPNCSDDTVRQKAKEWNDELVKRKEQEAA